jgi:hypothetical protein
MATFRGHPRRGAVVQLDGDPGLGRVGFDRSDNVKSRRGAPIPLPLCGICRPLMLRTSVRAS